MILGNAIISQRNTLFSQNLHSKVIKGEAGMNSEEIESELTLWDKKFTEDVKSGRFFNCPIIGLLILKKIISKIFGIVMKSFRTI